MIVSIVSRVFLVFLFIHGDLAQLLRKESRRGRLSHHAVDGSVTRDTLATDATTALDIDEDDAVDEASDASRETDSEEIDNSEEMFEIADKPKRKDKRKKKLKGNARYWRNTGKKGKLQQGGPGMLGHATNYMTKKEYKKLCKNGFPEECRKENIKEKLNPPKVCWSWGATVRTYVDNTCSTQSDEIGDFSFPRKRLKKFARISNPRRSKRIKTTCAAMNCATLDFPSLRKKKEVRSIYLRCMRKEMGVKLSEFHQRDDCGGRVEELMPPLVPSLPSAFFTLQACVKDPTAGLKDRWWKFVEPLDQSQYPCGFRKADEKCRTSGICQDPNDLNVSRMNFNCVDLEGGCNVTNCCEPAEDTCTTSTKCKWPMIPKEEWRHRKCSTLVDGCSVERCCEPAPCPEVDSPLGPVPNDHRAYCKDISKIIDPQLGLFCDRDDQQKCPDKCGHPKYCQRRCTKEMYETSDYNCTVTCSLYDCPANHSIQNPWSTNFTYENCCMAEDPTCTSGLKGTTVPEGTSCCNSTCDSCDGATCDADPNSTCCSAWIVNSGRLCDNIIPPCLARMYNNLGTGRCSDENGYFPNYYSQDSGHTSETCKAFCDSLATCDAYTIWDNGRCEIHTPNSAANPGSIAGWNYTAGDGGVEIVQAKGNKVDRRCMQKQFPVCSSTDGNTESSTYPCACGKTPAATVYCTSWSNELCTATNDRDGSCRSITNLPTPAPTDTCSNVGEDRWFSGKGRCCKGLTECEKEDRPTDDPRYCTSSDTATTGGYFPSTAGKMANKKLKYGTNCDDKMNVCRESEAECVAARGQDPTCLTGILSGTACCPKSCGTCGVGTGKDTPHAEQSCENRPPNNPVGNDCCATEPRSCDTNMPPCKVHQVRKADTAEAVRSCSVQSCSVAKASSSCTASSGCGVDQPAYYAFDGNIGTYWESARKTETEWNSAGRWLQFKFVGGELVAEYGIKTESDGCPVGWVVKSTNDEGADWAELDKQENRPCNTDETIYSMTTTERYRFYRWEFEDSVAGTACTSGACQYSYKIRDVILYIFKTCSTYSTACPAGKRNAGRKRTCGSPGPACDEDTCCEVACEWENDGVCDIPAICPWGTDVADCPACSKYTTPDACPPRCSWSGSTCKVPCAATSDCESAGLSGYLCDTNTYTCKVDDTPEVPMPKSL